MAKNHPMTRGTRDADLLFPQTLMMSKCEVPSYYGSHANKMTQGLRSGSIIFVKNPTCQPTVDLLRFIVQEVPCRSGLYLIHEANVKTLLLNIKMLVFLVRLTVPFAVSKQPLLSAQSRSIEDREIGKQFAPLWRVLPWWWRRRCFCRPSTRHSLKGPQHQGSKKRDWKNQCFHLPFLEVDSCLSLLHLICLFLVFLLKCCNGFSLKPAQPKCDARLLPFSPPGESRVLFPQLPFSIGSTRCYLFDSQHNRAWRYTLLQVEFYIWMLVPMRCIHCLVFLCFMCRAKEVIIGPGDSIIEGYRNHLFHHVPNQRRHMLTSRTHVFGVASGSVCNICTFQTFTLSWSSQRWSTTRRSSRFHTFPLETEYSSTTIASTTSYCSWSSWHFTSFEKLWWYRLLGRNSRKLMWGVDRRPTHNRQGTRLFEASTAQVARVAFHLCALENSFVFWCCNMSHLWLLPHMPSTTSTSSSFTLPTATEEERAAQSRTTRATPRTAGTSRTSPSSLSRQAAPSRITLAWSVAILVHAIPFRGVFPVHELFWFFLSKCLQLNFVVSHLFSWKILMMGPMRLFLLCLVPLLFMVLLMVVALIPTEWVTAQSMHSSESSEICCYHSRVDSQILTTTSRPSVKPWELTPPELQVLNKTLMLMLPRWRCLQHGNRMSTPSRKRSALSLHLYARLKRMQHPSPVVLARQDPGTFLDMVTALQPLGPSGPMAKGRLMTVEIRGVDLTLSQAMKMNRHGVPSYYNSQENSTTLGSRIGFTRMTRVWSAQTRSPMQMTSQRRVHLLHEQMKPVPHRTNVRVLCRGCDRHHHGQMPVPPEGTQAWVAATFCRATVLQRYERCIMLLHVVSTGRNDLCYRSRRLRYAIFMSWLRPPGRPRAHRICGMTPLLQNFAPILVPRSPIATRRSHLNDVTQQIILGPGTVHTRMES